MGGTSTVVNVLAKDLKQRGYNVYLGYYNDSRYPSTFFQEKIKLTISNKKSIEAFCKDNPIDIIYNTQPIGTNWELLKEVFPKAKIISAYHNRPLLRYFPLESLMNIYYDSNNWIHKIYTLAKIPLLPYWRYKSKKKEMKQYKNMEKYSDKIQLLSPQFIPVFKKILPNISNNKLIAIENPIVFNTTYPVENISSKQKRIVVVCSTNYQKRAYLMIKIWNEIEKDGHFDDWSFDFVGGGEGFKHITQMAIKLKLKRIHFVGYQQPENYYRQGSIFLMTSRFEGWPMVLMEAMQMGVVPIVFNSFESLTDIITDKENGFIIPNNNIKYFVERLKTLIANDDLRNRMAVKTIESCQRFTTEKITNKYISLFKELYLS
ncbi:MULTISPECIES: glycosyltransferase [Bacteroides]|nr:MULTISPECIES: glycosyltransferase [Bacteroides]MCM0316247.1 glycosyltransferase [Bacteroides fragilis]MCZ2663562.1 glycosyltransferase [Bacteroides fragilis]MDV6187257.1 glycosyltransferase [Bacteroides hominis (ex Liu et al. 2022)]